MIGGAWQASLRKEIERNLIQKTQLLAHRVETDRSGHSLADIAAQEGQAAGARVTIIDSYRQRAGRFRIYPRRHGKPCPRQEFAAALSGNVGSR